MRTGIFVAPIVVVALVVASTVSHADTLTPKGIDTRGVITHISKGVFELGIDSTLIFQSRSDEDAGGITTTSTQLTVVAALTPRYFIIDNLSASLSLGFLATSGSVDTVSTSETGGVFLAAADYYLRLGGGLFIKPGLGVGGFITNTSVDIGAGLSQDESGSGFAGRAQLGLVYYASSRFNVKAGLDFLMLFGSSTTEDGTDTSRSFQQFSLGWNVGFGYTF